MWRIASLAVIALGFGASAALGQQAVAVPTDPENFVEAFDDTPAVSGPALVGLALGIFADRLDLDNIRLSETPAGSSLVCVSATTQDGRFSANNQYTLPQASEAAAVRLSFVTRKYASDLASYVPLSLAIRAYVTGRTDCAARDAIYTPQVQGNGDLSLLTILVNSSSRRTTAKLTDASGETVSTATCAVVSGMARIAYDRICELDRPHDGAGVHTLTVEMDDGFGTESLDAQVHLPRAP